MSSFYNFANGSVANYATYFRNHGCVWVFHHIPKTAGSSLTRELAGTLSPYRNVFLGRAPVGDGNRGAAMMNEIDAFLEEHKTKFYRSVSGHFRPPHINRIREGLTNAKFFTFLRDPASRLISDYRYAKTPKHPPHKEFAARYPTIESYIEDAANQNKMWRFVCPGNRSVGTDSLTLVFKRYAFIGLVSEMSLHYTFLNALSTYPRSPASQVNVTEARSDNDVTMSPDLQRQIELANSDDYALYSEVESVLSAKTAEMADYVTERKAYFANV